jgi:hypothetical protein
VIFLLKACITSLQDDPAAASFFEKFLADEEGVLHPNHHLMVRAKAKLVLALSNPLTRADMQHKVHLCQAVLSVIDVILPGKRRRLHTYSTLKNIFRNTQRVQHPTKKLLPWMLQNQIWPAD